MQFDTHGQENLDRRIEVGEACLVAAGGTTSGEDPDRETYATDAISDILTAVLGPRGYYRYRDGVNEFVGGEGIVHQAQELLDRSLRSWEGDAEDYTVDETAEPTAKQKIEALLDEAQAQYAEITPGVNDDSVLEARRDTLEEVLAILNG